MRKALFGQHGTPTRAGVAGDAFHPRWRRVVDNSQWRRGCGGWCLNAETKAGMFLNWGP